MLRFATPPPSFLASFVNRYPDTCMEDNPLHVVFCFPPPLSVSQTNVGVAAFFCRNFPVFKELLPLH